MAAIVIVIMFKGTDNKPIKPIIKKAVNILGSIAINANLMLLKRIDNIVNIEINTRPIVKICERYKLCNTLL